MPNLKYTSKYNPLLSSSISITPYPIYTHLLYKIQSNLARPIYTHHDSKIQKQSSHAYAPSSSLFPISHANDAYHFLSLYPGVRLPYRELSAEYSDGIWEHIQIIGRAR